MVRFVEVDQEDIRLLVIEILDPFAEFRRHCFCKISKCCHDLVCVVLAVQIQRTGKGIFVNAGNKIDMCPVVLQNLKNLVFYKVLVQDRFDTSIYVSEAHCRRMLFVESIVQHVAHQNL